MAEAPLSIQGLSKSYGALVVTDAVTLDVRAGEVHALIGPNGAGKTTLMNQIAGVARPDAGRILIGGRDMTGAPAQSRARAGLARTFQITSIIPSLTALANVALAVQAHAARPLALFARADGDGRLDLYVANDLKPQYLFLNLGDGKFAERGLLSGAGLGHSGHAGHGVPGRGRDV